MIIGFKEQFKDRILSDTKIHTIRKDVTNRWHVGRIMHMATGVRTKNYCQFDEKMCLSTQLIKIWYKTNSVEVYIDDKPYAIFRGEETSKENCIRLNILALNDGFNSVANFFSWFSNDFSGKIIHWTDLIY